MDKRVIVRRLDKPLHFEAVNPAGNRIEVDGSDHAKAMSPIELLLAAIGSCSAFDVAMILEKQGRIIDDITVEVEGMRRAEGECSPYHHINLLFKIKGELDFNKAERVIDLALNKYCSVGATFRPETKLSFELRLND